jgi:hypothetical protein
MASTGGSNELEGLLTRTHDDTRRFKFLRIVNTEATQGTPYNFTVTLGNDVRLDSAIEIHLVSVVIPNIANNISEAIGNSVVAINFTIAGPFVEQIPDGFYNIAQLIATLTAEIDVFIAPSTISITQSPLTNLLTFTITGPETFQIVPNSFASTIGFFSLYPFATSATAGGIVSLYGSTIFYIHSHELGANITYLISTSGNVNDVNGMFTIPVTVPYGSVQTYVSTDQDRVVFGRIGNAARNFNITLRTNNGREYTELTPNQEVIITVKLFWSSSLR